MALRIAKPALPDDCLVDNRVYTDERLYRAEFDKLFLRVWSFVCHESEIANPGDFITTIAAGQPVIVCRNQDGALRAGVPVRALTRDPEAARLPTDFPPGYQWVSAIHSPIESSGHAAPGSRSLGRRLRGVLAESGLSVHRSG